ncbi:MAG: hypothetical protein KAH86_10320, partial [Methanosarcinales archaeon]|nr:hypothetical protein [Methanosarcinales archaeon]
RHVRGMRRYGNNYNTNQSLLAYSGDVKVAVSDDDSEAFEDAVNELIQDDDIDITKNKISEVEVEAETESEDETNSLLEKFKSLGDEWSEAETKHRKTLRKAADDPDNQPGSDEDNDDSENERNGMDKIS